MAQLSLCSPRRNASPLCICSRWVKVLTFKTGTKADYTPGQLAQAGRMADIWTLLLRLASNACWPSEQAQPTAYCVKSQDTSEHSRNWRLIEARSTNQIAAAPFRTCERSPTIRRPRHCHSGSAHPYKGYWRLSQVQDRENFCAAVCL